MIRAIIKKEWLKLKFYLISLLLLCTGVVIYFVYNLDFLFATVEPESMMWYRFVHIEQKSYQMFSYLFVIIATVISFAQFLPEKIRNRIKIIAHLPIPLHKSIFMHLLIGLFFILLLSILLSFAVGAIILNYYTYEIFLVMLKDFSFYILGSSIFYMALSSAIIEENKIISGLKILTGAIVVFVFFKDRYYLFDLLWVFIFVLFFFVVLESFYSIKKQRIKNPIYLTSLIFGLGFVFFQGNILYQDKFKKTFNKYYIFYSPILKDFVYQKNFGDHQFIYGVKDKREFDREEYESYLPFVYWRNLDIQKKLPIVIGDKEFDRDKIRKSRLSLSYSPALLQDIELKFYPFLNPDSSIGMIRFPEHMIQFNSLHVKAYNYDDGYNPVLSKEINDLFEKEGVTMPIVRVWGKATNMKPYDLGYLLLDSNDKLFNLKRRDDIITFREIEYPEGIELEYIKISENRQRKIAGYAIDSESNFYILDWDFNFKKVELEGFDHNRMKLQLISNAMYYLIRYNDADKYYAVVFSKDFEKLDKVEFD